MSAVAITTSSIPVGACVPVTDAQWALLVGLLSANADLSVNVHIGDDPPTDLTKIWARTVAGVPDRFYSYASGVWLAKHPIPTGFTILAPAGTTSADVDTLDGGEAGAVTPFTGPMWEIDTDFAAMFPIGTGTLPSGLVINEGDTGGEEKHALTIGEMPPHHHVLLVSQSETAGGSGVSRLRPNSTEADSDANSANTGGSGSPVVVEPHNNMPLYRARLFLKKSARGYYRAT